MPGMCWYGSYGTVGLERVLSNSHAKRATDHIETLISNLLFENVRFMPATSRNTAIGHIG